MGIGDSGLNPVYMASADREASGTITTQNLNLNGTATPGSAVECLTGSESSVAFQMLTNTLNQALSLYGTLNGVNWFIIGGLPFLNQSTGTYSTTIPAGATGIFTVSAADFARVRISTPNVATTGSATVFVLGSTALAVVSIDNVNLPVTPTPPAIGLKTSFTSAATTNATLVKPTAGSLFELTLCNPTATAASVKLYNKASLPVVGTDPPIATFTLAAGADRQLNFETLGKRFTAGIALAITGLPAATDITAAVAGVQVDGTFL